MALVGRLVSVCENANISFHFKCIMFLHDMQLDCIQLDLSQYQRRMRGDQLLFELMPFLHVIKLEWARRVD